MKNLIENFPQQLLEARTIGEKAVFTKVQKIKEVVISGLGGSGIGGTIASDVFSGSAKLPILVNKDYFLPAFVGPETLVIICSYSGNTEETLAALKQAISEKANIVCITSGGEMQRIAEENKIDFINIPGGFPPRACVGYSFTQILFVLNAYSVIGNEFKHEFQRAVDLIQNEQDQISIIAEGVAKKLFNKIPVIYSTAGNEGVAVRLRQQINENSKELCWHHVIPEMNHNELVGWTKQNDQLSVLILRNTDDFIRVQHRIEICKEIISKYTPNITEVFSKGESKLEKTIYTIHLGDWISYHLGVMKNVDLIEVNVIDYLKKSLASS